MIILLKHHAVKLQRHSDKKWVCNEFKLLTLLKALYYALVSSILQELTSVI